MTLLDAITSLMDKYIGQGNWVLTTTLPASGTDPAYDVTSLYNEMDQILGLIIPSISSQTSLPSGFKAVINTDNLKADIRVGRIKMTWDKKKIIFNNKINTIVSIIATGGILGIDDPQITPL